MPAAAKLMLVDDHQSNRLVLSAILEDDYELCEAHNGTQCLEQVESAQPDLILLDVDMPDIKGYDVCRALKMNPATAMIPVIFVSAMDLPEQRLEGFEAGGDEYVVKPVDVDVLRQKISATLDVRASYGRLQQQARDAMNVALEAMTASSEMGVLIQFMKQSNACRDFAELADATVASLQQLGLATCMMITDAGKADYFGCNVQSLEARAMTKCQHVGRICDFGSRSVFSDDMVVILIKNMPLDEPARYGRIKDNVAVLLSMVSTRIRSIQMEMELNGRRSDIIRALITIAEEKLMLVHDRIISHEKKVEQIMQDLISRLEEKMLFLGLEEDQEIALRQLASDASADIQRLGAVSEDLNAALGEILEGLYKLLEK